LCDACGRTSRHSLSLSAWRNQYESVSGPLQGARLAVILTLENF
jgi:hypothetical protein